MGIHVSVKNATLGATLKMDLAPNETVYDIIESAAEFWKKDPRAYVIRKGKSLLSASDTIMEANIMNDDVLEILPDPEGG
ncbi:MAG: hypothetical protein LBE48_02185 [Methanomassiliicoccaceae archaeon]|jgi:hypothetical protein|nr:hypothetical protein [Methanomassiliicoccaceae archaeon]